MQKPPIVEEQKNALRAALNQQNRQAPYIDRSLKNLETHMNRGFNLTCIIGDALSFALQAWYHVPNELHSTLPMVATTNSNAATPLVNALIFAAQDDPHSDKLTIFKNAAAWVSSQQERANILAMIDGERKKGNSSHIAEVAGCPALGTPAFFGSRDLVDEMKVAIRL